MVHLSLYHFAHCLEDSFEGVHSFCTLEFESARELYDWVIRATGLRPLELVIDTFPEGEIEELDGEQEKHRRLAVKTARRR